LQITIYMCENGRNIIYFASTCPLAMIFSVFAMLVSPK
jgi:hypothetical protein